jgi:uncharacterized iron-regulated protein
MMHATKNQAAWRGRVAAIILVVAVGLIGCAGKVRSVKINGLTQSFAAGEIISAAAGGPVDFQAMLADMRSVRVVYVGETHSNPAHHAIQLQVITALHEIHPDLVVGMEMVDHSYQEVLDEWSAGGMAEADFLRKTHWYVNWRWDFGLYRDIYRFARDARIRLVALNIPFHIPPKIAAGGLDSLRPEDRSHLPLHIDTSDPEHRAYVRKIFDRHPMHAKKSFATFYEAQCTWEDAMAERVAEASRHAPMVVLAGNGHIIRKFGIPRRVYARTGAPFRTLYPLSAGAEATRDFADYLWVTP